jgi:flagellar biosynthesis chaperone FliJ
MSTVLQPVLDLEKQLEDAKAKAIQTLLKQREGIDEQLTRLGHGKRGRKPAAAQ